LIELISVDPWSKYCHQPTALGGRSIDPSSLHSSFKNPPPPPPKIAQLHNSPKAAAALEELDLAGRVGQMLHLSVKKVLFDYPNDPFVDKSKVRWWWSLGVQVCCASVFCLVVLATWSTP
jgi:hypothetical protein